MEDWKFISMVWCLVNTLSAQSINILELQWHSGLKWETPDGRGQSWPWQLTLTVDLHIGGTCMYLSMVNFFKHISCLIISDRYYGNHLIHIVTSLIYHTAVCRCIGSWYSIRSHLSCSHPAMRQPFIEQLCMFSFFCIFFINLQPNSCFHLFDTIQYNNTYFEIRSPQGAKNVYIKEKSIIDR